MLEKMPDPILPGGLDNIELEFVTSIYKYLMDKSYYYEKIFSNITSEDNEVLCFNLKAQYTAYNEVALYVGQLIEQVKNNTALNKLSMVEKELNTFKARENKRLEEERNNELRKLQQEIADLKNENEKLKIELAEVVKSAGFSTSAGS